MLCGDLAIFSYDPSTNLTSTLYTINSLSAPREPASLLTQLNGVLYTVTIYGGIYGYGALISWTPSTNTYATLHNFGASPYHDH